MAQCGTRGKRVDQFAFVDKGDGTFTVAIEGIKEEKVAEVEADAVAALRPIYATQSPASPFFVVGLVKVN